MTATADTRVADSVEAAIGALEQLASSLRRSGFEDGAPAYSRMAEVLVAQRLFHQPGGAGAPPRFDHLGDVAREVFELLEPYVAAMRRLATMAPDRLDEAATEAVRAQLEKRGRRGATASVLSRSAHVPAPVAQRVLAALVADGSVVTRTAGDVVSYRLAGARRSGS
ncbi:hypothetical protein [Nocardioides coralli]|uniref:hypothetical protein n=1 Tax=Nocardioides coralli TaxID=2872154 RepID=UPI001CA435A4|nr:hypothetical protein [Nocardioides coralli]QZY28960.1 hypothetical protein K6T13_16215 [Nocardioides coralli]